MARTHVHDGGIKGILNSACLVIVTLNSQCVVPVCSPTVGRPSVKHMEDDATQTEKMAWHTYESVMCYNTQCQIPVVLAEGYMYIHTHIYIYMYMYKYIYIHMYMYIYIHICIYICMHTCMFMYPHMYTHINTYVKI